MSERTCDACGKRKDVEGGKTCPNGHFVCKDCVWTTYGPFGLFVGEAKYCPLCKEDLR